jgi:hypothetical protein
MKEKIKIPAKPVKAPPDDGPEDMELTIPRQSADALNIAGNAFDAKTKERFGGLNAENSVFEKGTLFRTR